MDRKSAFDDEGLFLSVVIDIKQVLFTTPSYLVVTTPNANMHSARMFGEHPALATNRNTTTLVETALKTELPPYLPREGGYILPMYEVVELVLKVIRLGEQHRLLTVVEALPKLEVRGAATPIILGKPRH